MRRSRRIALGLVVSVGLTLSACSPRDEDEEEYRLGSYHNIIYNSWGQPYQVGSDRSVRPLPADHPDYGAAVAEGREIASGGKAASGRTYVTRGGFGSTGARLSSGS